MRLPRVVLGSILLAGCAAPGGPTATSSDTLPAVAAAHAEQDLPDADPPPVSTVAAPVATFDVDQILADATPEDVERFGGIDCLTEMAHIAVAAERYQIRSGLWPSTLDDIGDDLDVPITLWMFEGGADSVVPAAGSPCKDVAADEARRDVASACGITRRTLETAVDVYVAQHAVAPTDQDQLVADRIIVESYPDFQIVAGAVDMVPGSECELLLAEEDARRADLDAASSTSPQACDVNRKTFETAIEAHLAQFGRLPLTEADLVTSDMLRAESADFDLGVDGTVVVAPGSPCE